MKTKNSEQPDNTANPFTAEDLLGIGEKQDERFKFASNLYAGIKTITDIKPNELKLIVKLYYFAKECTKYEINEKIPKISEIVEDALDTYYKLSISSKRQGRKEAIRFLTSNANEEENKKGILNRFLRN